MRPVRRSFSLQADNGSAAMLSREAATRLLTTRACTLGLATRLPLKCSRCTGRAGQRRNLQLASRIRWSHLSRETALRCRFSGLRVACHALVTSHLARLAVSVVESLIESCYIALEPLNRN